MNTDAQRNLPPIRAVVDTNVLFSAVTHRGVPYRIVEAGQAGQFLWVISAEIMFEYVDVLSEHGLVSALLHKSVSKTESPFPPLLS